MQDLSLRVPYPSCLRGELKLSIDYLVADYYVLLKLTINACNSDFADVWLV